MTMLPRNMTSPSVSPSAGTGVMVSGSITVEVLERRIAHALARLQRRPPVRGQARPTRSCHSLTTAGP